MTSLAPMGSRQEWGFSNPHSPVGTGKSPLLSEGVSLPPAGKAIFRDLARPDGVENRSGGFPTPTPPWGQESPPSCLKAYPCRRRERRYSVTSLAPMGSKQEWGFSYPHSPGGQENPPSCLKAYPCRRRGRRYSVTSLAPMGSRQEWGFSYPHSSGGTGKSPLLSGSTDRDKADLILSALVVLLTVPFSLLSL